MDDVTSAGKPIRWTLHAIARVATAGIDWRLVEAAIAEPDRVAPGADGRTVYMKRYTGVGSPKPRLVCVVVEELPTELVIITAIETSNMKKYLGDER